MAKVNGTGLVYRNDVPALLTDDEGNVSETTRSVYEMWVSDRLLFLVSVLNDDPSLQILLGKPDADHTGEWHYSVGKAMKSLHVLPSTDGSEVPDGFAEHVDGLSLQQYVYPRAALIITNMYNLGVVPE